MRSRSFVISLIGHLIALGLLAHFVIFPAYRKKSADFNLVAPLPSVNVAKPPLSPSNGSGSLGNEVTVATPAPAQNLPQIISTDSSAPADIASGMQPQLDQMLRNGQGLARGLGHGQGSGIGDGQGNDLFGLKISGKLGVILDVSGSMYARDLAVLKHIESRFSGYQIVLAGSCDFSVPPGKQVRETRSRKNVPQPIRAALESHYGIDLWGDENTIPLDAFDLLMDQGVESIYMFSDFEDPVSDQEVLTMGNKLKSKGIHLFLHSVEMDPANSLKTVAQETGGGVVVLDITKPPATDANAAAEDPH